MCTKLLDTNFQNMLVNVSLSLSTQEAGVVVKSKAMHFFGLRSASSIPVSAAFQLMILIGAIEYIHLFENTSFKEEITVPIDFS